MRLIVCAAIACTAGAFVAPGPSQAARQAVKTFGVFNEKKGSGKKKGWRRFIRFFKERYPETRLRELPRIFERFFEMSPNTARECALPHHRSRVRLHGNRDASQRPLPEGKL